METLEIDGSYGEGGGQLLRTAAYFSVATGRPIRVDNIRAGRDVPGLRPQHAAVLRVLRDISNGTLEGGEVGSTRVHFAPGRPTGASIAIDLGTAASITLVLQALVPAVALSCSSLRASLVGGTDVPWSPTSDYMVSVTRPAFALLGIDFECRIGRRGYYPRGGGTAEVAIGPCRRVKAISLPETTRAGRVSVTSRCGALPAHVAERQSSAASRLLEREGIEVGETVTSTEESASPGSSTLVSLASAERFIGADALGRRGLPAEKIGEAAARRFLQDFRSGASVDQNLADSIAPVLSMGDAPSTFFVSEITGHLRTSLHVAHLFTGAAAQFSKGKRSSMVTIIPNKIANKVS